MKEGNWGMPPVTKKLEEEPKKKVLEHPEQKEDEVFLGYYPDSDSEEDLLEEGGLEIGSFETIKYRTKRQGNLNQSGQRPVFVKSWEIIESEKEE